MHVLGRVEQILMSRMKWKLSADGGLDGSSVWIPVTFSQISFCCVQMVVFRLPNNRYLLPQGPRTSWAPAWRTASRPSSTPAACTWSAPTTTRTTSSGELDVRVHGKFAKFLKKDKGRTTESRLILRPGYIIDAFLNEVAAFFVFHKQAWRRQKQERCPKQSSHKRNKTDVRVSTSRQMTPWDVINNSFC